MLTDKNGNPRLIISNSYLDIDIFMFDLEELEMQDCDTIYKYRLLDEEGEEVEEYFYMTSLQAIKDQLPEEWEDEDMTNYLEN